MSSKSFRNCYLIYPILSIISISIFYVIYLSILDFKNSVNKNYKNYTQSCEYSYITFKIWDCFSWKSMNYLIFLLVLKLFCFYLFNHKVYKVPSKILFYINKENEKKQKLINLKRYQRRSIIDTFKER